MKTGLTLSQLAAKIEGNKELKHDFIAQTATTTMQIQEDRTPVLELPGDQGTFPLLPVAHDQIAARLNIPLPITTGCGLMRRTCWRRTSMLGFAKTRKSE